MPHRLNEQELATILAALRYWQKDALRGAAETPDESPDITLLPVQEYFNVKLELFPLSEAQIDDLCEKLNS